MKWAGAIRLINDTDVLAILVEGGHLTLRNTIVHETTGGDPAAIEVRRGVLDLDGNTFVIHGDREYLQQAVNDYIVANSLVIEVHQPNAAGVM